MGDSKAPHPAHPSNLPTCQPAQCRPNCGTLIFELSNGGIPPADILAKDSGLAWYRLVAAESYRIYQPDNLVASSPVRWRQ
jgi:hypothetical protein